MKDGEACVAMAIDMQRRMGALRDSYDHLGLNEPLEMRIGINSGYCTVGNFGSFERIDYTIVGTPVNIASRLQDAGEPGTITVSRNTHALVADRFEFASLGRLQLKGIVDEVDAYRVLFEAVEGADAATTPEGQMRALKERLRRLDIDKLGDAEKDELLKSMSKLLGR